MRRFLPKLALLLAAGLALTAHPMGNFSVSHYTRIEPAKSGVQVTYALDLAELPSFELLQKWQASVDTPAAQLQQRAVSEAREWAKGLQFSSAGIVVTPKFLGADLVVGAGAGNLPVLRITSRLALPAVRGPLDFEDRNYPNRAGWKEIVIRAGEGATITRTSHPSTDVSRGLTAYPEDPGVAPPQDLRASLEWSGPAVKTTANLNSGNSSSTHPVVAPIQQPKTVGDVSSSSPAAQNASASQGAVVRGDYLSELLSKRDLSLGMILMGLAVAFGLGALHATTPGHGKTMVAAYLVGERGTSKHAVILGAVTTFTHTASVFLLGIGTYFFAGSIVPEQVSKWLGVISGLSIVAIGGWLLFQRARRLAQSATAHAHHHHHDHDHDHEHHSHVHEPALAAAAAHHHHRHDHAHPHDHAHSHSHDHHHHDDHHGHAHDHAHGHSYSHDHGDGVHHHHHVPDGPVTMGSLIALGASGGLVPCPSALVLLLSSIAIGRVGFGLLLLTSFSLGLASVLIAIGLVVLYAKNLLPEGATTGKGPFFRWVPVLSAAVIMCVGGIMTAMSLGWMKAGA